jgi:hypothetical protein
LNATLTEDGQDAIPLNNQPVAFELNGSEKKTTTDQFGKAKSVCFITFDSIAPAKPSFFYLGSVFNNGATSSRKFKTTQINNSPSTGAAPAGGGTCQFLIFDADQSFAANGGTGTINVRSFPRSCTWTATANDPWILITSGASGTGNGSVSYTVDSHTSPTPRAGSITVAGITYNVLQGADFLDVPPSNAFYTEIGKLSARGVTLGIGGGNYGPSQLVSREQMAAFILRAKGEFNPPTPASQRFNDVSPSNPFYNFIDRLAELQITLGCGGGNYCPSQPVTREQMAAFMIRGLGEFTPTEPFEQRFQDVPLPNPFSAFIDSMAVRRITLGCATNPARYCPTGQVTREQMAAFLVRAFDL